MALQDFCQILKWGIRCSRIHVTKSPEARQFDSFHTGVFSYTFPRQGLPLMLSTALQDDSLSARHKIFLAYAVSKAFWQYYNSEWMNVEWSLETMHLLQTESHESQAPFLKINSVKSEDSKHDEHEVVGTDGIPHIHHHPYILNLGLILVQLGSVTSDRTSFAASTAHLTGTIRNNDLYVSCCTAIAGPEWPPIDLPTKEKQR